MLLKVVTFVLLASAAYADNFEVGPLYDSLDMFRIPKDDVPELTHNMEIYAPKADGTYPLVYFLDGFAGLIPGFVYSHYVKHIASYGYAVLVPQKINFVGEFSGFGINEVLDWSKLNLNDLMRANGGWPSGFEIDFTEIYMAGHSSGNHVIGGFLEHDCTPDIKAWIMLSPVDGSDFQDQIITPGETLPYSLPSVILCAGFDAYSGHPEFDNYPACAAEEVANRRFYDALSADVWMLNATAYGHMDFLNPLVVEFNQELLKFCYTPPELTAEQLDTYVRYVGGQTVSFIEGVKGDCTQFDYFEDTSLLIVDVVAESKGLGAAGACGQGGCAYISH